MPITISEADDILRLVFPEWVNELNLQVVGIEGDCVSIRMPSNSLILRTGGSIAGQASIALSDTAMVIALANSLGEFRPVGTVDLGFSFLRPLNKGDIVCEASVMRLGRSMAFCRAEIREQGSDKLAVHATGTYSVPPATLS